MFYWFHTPTTALFFPGQTQTLAEPQKQQRVPPKAKSSPRRNGTVLMNMLERLLETTEIDARDVETEQTLLLHERLRNNLDDLERSHHDVTVNDG